MKVSDLMGDSWKMCLGVRTAFQAKPVVAINDIPDTITDRQFEKLLKISFADDADLAKEIDYLVCRIDLTSNHVYYMNKNNIDIMDWKEFVEYIKDEMSDDLETGDFRR